MPLAKSAASLPKAWPSSVLYLRAPAHSSKLDLEKHQALISQRSDIAPDAFVYKNTPSYSHIKIMEITDKAHPAYGQAGLCADQNLPPDTFILPYLGYVHDESDLDEKSDYDLSLDRNLGISVDATRMGNESRFINDYRGISPAPNADFRDVFVHVGKGKVEKSIGIFVLGAGKSGRRAKGIRRGEEILVSYGKSFWNERRADEE